MIKVWKVLFEGNPIEYSGEYAMTTTSENMFTHLSGIDVTKLDFTTRFTFCVLIWKKQIYCKSDTGVIQTYKDVKRYENLLRTMIGFPLNMLAVLIFTEGIRVKN